MSLPIHFHYPPVEQLEIHLENQQSVYLSASQELRSLEKAEKTKLTSFFELCKNDDLARKLLYIEVPQYYKWESTGKYWKKRERGKLDGDNNH